MSTCPEKDIHSMYADQELPEQYAAVYTSHVAGCASCRKQQQKIEHLRRLLKEDCSSLTIDNQALEQSFDRLRARMSYHSVSRRAASPLSYSVRWAVPAAAAALVFALVLPLKTPPVSGTEAAQVSSPVLSFSSFGGETAAPVSYSRSGASPSSVYSMPALSGMNVSYNAQTDLSLRPSFSSLDVFRPNLSSSAEGTITLRFRLAPPLTSNRIAPILISNSVLSVGESDYADLVNSVAP